MSVLSKLLHRNRQVVPTLDRKHPLVVALARDLRILHALPISSEEERAVWYSQAQDFRRKLNEEYLEVYDSLPHEIEHYLDDAGIRARDEGYARYQEKLLTDLLSVE